MTSARRRPSFRQADLARALRAAASAGLNVVRSEIDAEGKIVLVYGRADSGQPVVDELEEWRRRNAGAA